MNTREDSELTRLKFEAIQQFVVSGALEGNALGMIGLLQILSTKYGQTPRVTYG